MRIQIKDIVGAVGGRPSSHEMDGFVSSVIIDSRKAAPGSLFVAFSGERTDGHLYLQDCADKGAVAALVERDVLAPPGLVAIHVDSTLDALQKLATWYRHQFEDLKVVGVTGSSGKTTTKELVAAVAESGFEVLKTRGNHNNEIGLPLAMFELEREHQVAILEMGMSARGEIAQLARISKPNIGVITNIGEAHIEILGSQEEIMHAKFELAENLVSPGTMVLNGDDPWQRKRAESLTNVLFYGVNDGNDIWASQIETTNTGSKFTVNWSGGSIDITLQLPGMHNVSNSLSAFAVGLELGLDATQIVQALSGVRPASGRLETTEVNGITVIDDSYNANPHSTMVALDFLASFPGTRRRVAFIGDMLELGSIAQEKHQMIGREVFEHNIQYLVAVGGFAQDIRDGAVKAGMNPSSIRTYNSSQDAIEALGELKDLDVVLFKGSRGIAMEQIVKTLKDGGQGQC